MARTSRGVAALLALAAFAYEVRAQQPRPAPAPIANAPSPAPVDSALLTAEGTVRAAYRFISFAPGTHNDWSKLRGLFLPEAVVVLQNSRTTHAALSVDGFIAGFVRFDSTAAAANRGFHETVLALHAVTYVDVAHVSVLYEAEVINGGRPPQRGVDNWEAVRRDGRWWLVAITNQILSPDTPIPAELQQP